MCVYVCANVCINNVGVQQVVADGEGAACAPACPACSPAHTHTHTHTQRDTHPHTSTHIHTHTQPHSLTAIHLQFLANTDCRMQLGSQLWLMKRATLPCSQPGGGGGAASPHPPPS
jgi:hypothetical protein